MKQSGKEKKQSVSEVLHNNLSLLKQCFQIAPGFMICYVIENIRNEFVIFMEFTFGFNYVLECAEFGRPFKDAAIFLLCLLAFVVAGLLFNSFLYQKIQMKAQPEIVYRLKSQLYQKAKEIDLDCYDNPKFYNDYVLAVSEVENQVERVLNLLSQVLTGVTSLLLTGTFFITNDPVSLIFVMVSFAGSLQAGKALNKLKFHIRQEKNPSERKQKYVNRVFYLNEYAKEIRLNTEVSKELLKEFDQTSSDILQIDCKNAGKRLRLTMLKDYLMSDFLMDVVYMIYLIVSAMVWHSITYSNVAVMRGTAGRMKSRMRFLSDAYPAATEISMYMEKMKLFQNTEPKIVSRKNLPVPREPKEIEFQNVSFSYTDGGKKVLQNLNLKIDAMSRIAIVGYNGAGKTTLIKLLMRLYDPDEGVILLDGVDIRDYDISEYRKRIGTVFQDYKIFAATVEENVRMDFECEKEEAKVSEALHESGFDSRLNTLEKGIHTNLSCEFEEDGVDLSGGEAQKVAISRVFYKESSLMILDEPSSALDPIAEYQLNHSMTKASLDKSVVFISHRLSTTRIADTIYMLEKGKVIEQGNHEKLLKQNGKYAQMWRVQAGHYLA